MHIAFVYRTNQNTSTVYKRFGDHTSGRVLCERSRGAATPFSSKSLLLHGTHDRLWNRSTLFQVKLPPILCYEMMCSSTVDRREVCDEHVSFRHAELTCQAPTFLCELDEGHGGSALQDGRRRGREMAEAATRENHRCGTEKECTGWFWESLYLLLLPQRKKNNTWTHFLIKSRSLHSTFVDTQTRNLRRRLHVSRCCDAHEIPRYVRRCR